MPNAIQSGPLVVLHTCAVAARGGRDTIDRYEIAFALPDTRHPALILEAGPPLYDEAAALEGTATRVRVTWHVDLDAGRRRRVLDALDPVDAGDQARPTPPARRTP
jgi:hypothetical protein